MVELRDAKIADHVRFVFSTLLLLFSAVVTCYAIIQVKTNFWHIVPGWAALLLFVVDLIILGIVEGLQIALVELKRQHPSTYRSSHPRAFNLGQTSFKGDNVERFLMGRQVFVVVLVFFAAKLTTIHLEEGEDFLFPTPAWFRSVFLESGILACLVVVNVAQLMPQIVAAKYPVHFLQFVIMKPAYYICTFVELTGITHVCWLLSAFISWASRMTNDDFSLTDSTRVSSASDILDQAEEKISIVCSNMEPCEDQVTSKMIPEDTKSPMTVTTDELMKFTNVIKAIQQNMSSDALSLMRYYLHNHPERFQQFPSVIGNIIYPSPQTLAEHLRVQGHEVPAFLTDISAKNHIPPHVVATELLIQNKSLQEELAGIKKKINTV